MSALVASALRITRHEVSCVDGRWQVTQEVENFSDVIWSGSYVELMRDWGSYLPAVFSASGTKFAMRGGSRYDSLCMTYEVRYDFGGMRPDICEGEFASREDAERYMAAFPHNADRCFAVIQEVL